MSSKSSQLQELLEPSVTALGLVLWGVEYLSQGRNSTLRIYIENTDPDAGISVEDCARVSHQVSGILDVEDPIAGEYRLEVSSPGMERPLYTLEQFAKYIGHPVQIRLRMAFEGRRKFQGTFKGIENDDELVLEVDGEEYLLPFDWLDKANLIAVFD